LVYCEDLEANDISRYTDFLVNEIEVGGNVVHLTNDRAPKFPRVAAVNFAAPV